MTLRLPLTLPPYTPTSWELKLPGYPVITGTWRSSSYPEILGSLPTDSEWSLRFENVTSDQALKLMLPWRATGGGQWPLTSLPDELAGGVDDANFRKRLTGTIWTIADKPQEESVKNGRFNVTIRLIYELTFDSVYGPGNPVPPTRTNELIGLNLPSVLTVAGLAVDFIEIFQNIEAGNSEVLALELIDTLTVSALATGLDQTARLEAAGLALVSLNLPNTLSVIGTVSAYDPAASSLASGPVVTMSLSASLGVAGTALIGTDIPVNSITYEQSSTFPGTFAADNPSMTDKTLVNLGAATDLGNPAWIEMNLGRNYGVAKVIIGTATSNIPGSWNKSFTENKIVEYSSDRSVWTTAFNTGTFAADGIYTFNTNFTARVIRIRTTGNDYVALSEFYALGAGQTY